jgi:hypothetical protein
LQEIKSLKRVAKPTHLNGNLCQGQIHTSLAAHHVQDWSMLASLASSSTTETHMAQTLMAQKFFVPLAESSEEGERVYNLFIEKTGHPLAHPTARLQRIRFRRFKRGCYTAEVNSEIPNWPEPGGRVFAIIEFADFIQIFSTFCAWLYPIRVKPHEVIERVYFEDYPAEGQSQSTSIPAFF